MGAAYDWLLEASFGATLGKALVGIRVVRTSRRSALAASAIRNLLRIVDGLGFYLVGAMVAGCSRCRQRLGDLCAGTAVVEEEFSTARKMLALALWIAVLSGAAWAVPRICSENNAGQHTRFLNQVVEVEWAGTPRQLLKAAKEVEVEGGRKPARRWGPRVIDVDILLFGDERLNTTVLVIPHPRIAERGFVRESLAELGVKTLSQAGRALVNR